MIRYGYFFTKWLIVTKRTQTAKRGKKMKKLVEHVQRHPFTEEGVVTFNGNHSHRESRVNPQTEDEAAAADRKSERPSQPFTFHDSPTMANVLLP